MRKRSIILIALLAVCVCMVILPRDAKAASVDDLTYTIQDGKVTITDCNESASGELVIPATIEGYPVVAIGDEAFRECTQLESVVIPEGVTSIGVRAFGTRYNTVALRKISLPSTLVSLGECAFESCPKLKEVHIADLKAYLKLEFSLVDGGNPFAGYGDLYIGGNKITDLVIPAGVQTIPACAFSQCSSITSVTFSESGTTIGEWAFSECQNLKDINLDNVTKIEDAAFANCRALESVTLPNHQIDFTAGSFVNTVLLASADNDYYSHDEQGGLYNKDKTTLYYACIKKFGEGRSFVLPTSVTRIEQEALISCRHVLYAGTEAEWRRIDIGMYNPTGGDYVCYNYVPGKDYHFWTERWENGEATCKQGAEIHERCHVCRVSRTVYSEKRVTHDWSESLTPYFEDFDTYLCITCGKVKVEGVVNIHNKNNHFHKNAKIEVIVIDENRYPDAHEVVSEALKNHHDYVAYDISAILEGEYVQPDGTIEIEIVIPENFNMDTITIAYVSDDGQVVEIPCTVDKEKRVAKFKTNHFSYYAMATEATCTTHVYDHNCDTDCNICGQVRTTTHSYTSSWNKDKTGHWHECSACKEKKDFSAHTPGADATETSAQTCTTCGYLIKAALNHTHSYASAWTSNENGHWHDCSGCGEQGSYEAHKPGAAATATTDQTCTVCGKVLVKATGISTPVTQPTTPPAVEETVPEATTEPGGTTEPVGTTEPAESQTQASTQPTTSTATNAATEPSTTPVDTDKEKEDSFAWIWIVCAVVLLGGGGAAGVIIWKKKH